MQKIDFLWPLVDLPAEMTPSTMQTGHKIVKVLESLNLLKEGNILHPAVLRQLTQDLNTAPWTEIDSNSTIILHMKKKSSHIISVINFGKK